MKPGRMLSTYNIIYVPYVSRQRVKKAAGAETTVYHYDLDGKLIAESLPGGAMTREYLYMGKVRVAMVDVAGGNTLYHYLNDRLGTPEILTDANGTVVWEAWYEPFGEAHIHPSSSVVNNHRFPGQYYDQETGLHYNYHRYYDPRTGRYITPDPIGQVGGINLYPYAENNPINLIDPLGLINPKRIAFGAVEATGGLIGIGLAATAEIGSAGTATIVAIGLAGFAVPAFAHGVSEVIAGFLETKKQEFGQIPPVSLPAVVILTFRGGDFRAAMWAETASEVVFISGNTVKIFGATKLLTADEWRKTQMEFLKLGIDILDVAFDSIVLQEFQERKSVCE